MLHVNFRDLRSRHTNYSSQKGSHLLEFAIVVPILLFLMIGAFDINTALQGYTAIQEGVKKSLRCVYPTDGGCVSANSGTINTNYKVTGVQGNKIFVVDTFDYSADATWLTMPRYNAVPNVTVLDQVTYSYNEPEHKQSGDIAYLLQTYTVPFVSGDDLNPRFGTPPSVTGQNNNQRLNFNNNYPRFETTTPEGSPPTFFKKEADSIKMQNDFYSSADVEKFIGATTPFNIPSPFNENTACFISDKLDSPEGEANSALFNKSCNRTNARIAFHVTGTTYAAANNAEGDVLLKIIYENEKGEFNNDPKYSEHPEDNYGGRQISGDSGNDDFTARGLTLEDCETDKDGRIVKNTCKYANANDKFTDKYYKEAFAHNGIEVPYNRRFKIAFFLKSRNGNIGWKADSVRIFTSVFEPVLEKDIDCNDWVNTEQAKRIYCPTNHPSLLHARVTGTKDTRFQINTTDASCPKNYGSKNPQADCLSVCPTAEPGAFNVSCSTIPKSMPELAINSYLPSDCQNLIPNESLHSAELKKYKVLNNFAITESAEPGDVFITEQDPGLLLKSEETKDIYLCTELVHKILDEQSSEPAENRPLLKSDSLFVGEKFTLGDNWEDILKQHAKELLKENSLPDSAFIKVGKVQSGVKIFNEMPAYPYTMQVTDVNQHTKKDFGSYDGKNMPSECKDGNYVCKVEFDGYTDGTHAYSEIKLDVATELGKNEINSSFPRATFDSVNDSYRATLSGNIDTLTNTATFTASMNVPMILLGMQDINLSYTDSHRLEKNFAQ